MKRIIGLVLLVLAISGTVGVVRNFAKDKDSQAQTQTTASSAYKQGQKVGKYSAPFIVLLLGIYGLRLLLGSDEAPRPTTPAIRRSPTSNLPPPGDPSLRGGQNTFATNPAMLRISIWQWLAANPWVPITAVCLAVVGAVFIFIKLPVAIVLMLAAGTLTFKEVTEAKSKFFGGDVCPGIVLSAQQNLVAVYTDLVAAGDRPYPVIQILKQPLHRMTTGQAYDGMRVATAAMYLGDVKAPAWKNFWPEVINCVVHDPTEIERVLGSISELEWQKLDVCLAQIPVANLGLHHISPACLIGLESDESQPPYLGREAGLAPARPWYKSPAAIFAFVAVGLMAAMMLTSIVIVALARPKNHLPAFPNHPPAAMQPPTMPQPPVASPSQTPAIATQPAPTPPAAPAQTVQYAVGNYVEANWAGDWLPGKITRINPGGYSVFVQLEDRRFPQPIVLSTRQIRPK